MHKVLVACEEDRVQEYGSEEEASRIHDSLQC